MNYPDINVMRRDISKVYDGPNWTAKVKHMPDGQVFAIWNKFCDEGKFKKLQRKTIHSLEDKIQEKRADAAVVYESYQGEQLAFDI